MKTPSEISAEVKLRPKQITNPLVYDEITMADTESLLGTKNPLVELDPLEDKPVIAFGRAVYETQPQKATDNLLRTVQVLSMKLEQNLWLLPTYERLPYPFAVYWPLACAFKWEKQKDRKFDWFVWSDDDVLFRPEDVTTLISAAKEHGAPFVSAVPYDRFPPHCPSVMEMYENVPYKWIKAPESGTYPCLTVGLCLAVFHRSVFDMVEEPWFGVCSPSRGFSGLNPDWWWSYQMHKAGLMPHVCCDTDVTHLGDKKQVSRGLSERWQEKVLPTFIDKYPHMGEDKRALSPVSGATIITSPDHDDGRQELVAPPVPMVPKSVSK